VGLTWGGEDLSSALGAETNRLPDGTYADPYRLTRSLTLIGAAAAQVRAIDSVYVAFRDEVGLEAECLAGRRDGFTGKLAIHPGQVPVINRAYTPSAEAIARAKSVIAAFEASAGAGVVSLDGEMLDRPHLLRARAVVEAGGAL
jgi:citrate lyase subunit beta / citryl-CoA lyase